jgi:rRNA maturation protein Nop10
MTSHILKCPSCLSYGLSEGCACGAHRVSPKPPKYSPEDKWASYRRKYKEMHPLEALRKGGKEA